MNKTVIFKFVIVIGIFVGITFGVIAAAQNKSGENQDISFQVIAEKRTYLKGEPVRLRVQIVNKQKTDVKFTSPHESRLWVSTDKENYKLHDGAPRDDSIYSFLTLKAGQSRQMKLSPFLWNGKPNYSNLVGDTQSIKEADEKTKVTTDYIFQNAGTYYVTVKTKIKTGDNQTANKIEAESAEIIIKEPVDDDLEVWKKIEGKIDITFLMQYGRFTDSSASNPEKQNNLSQEVEQIIINHPNSIYSKYLKEGLEKLKADTEIKFKQPN